MIENELQLFMKSAIEKQEQIIKRTIEEGYKFIALRTETKYDLPDAQAVTSYSYKGLNSLDCPDAEVLYAQDFRFYNLEKARAWLESQGS